jgi:DNA-binding SARP family transcriptional activator/TolB-like protein/Tfp pilus assembly protein PilF
MIQLRTLGPIDIRGSDGQELRGVLAQPKRAALLVYLALATPRGPHRRDGLLALFWPEHDAEHARNSLSQSVHVLRRSLGTNAIISGNGDTLSLERGELWCDAIAFEEALNGGKPAEAIELYRGDLLEGFHVTGVPEFDHWHETERARLAGCYARAVETVAKEREASGDLEGAVGWWRRLAARDPYSSRVALRLMRALAAAGDQAGAVQHARVHEALLREELDILPDTEVAAFVKQLKSASPQRDERPSQGAGSPAFEPTSASAALSESNPAVTYPHGSIRGGRQRSRTALLAGVLVALLTVGGGAIALRNGAQGPARPLIRSLAVLPLDNLSGDSTQQTFTNGMHDLLITELARNPQLSVISRTSMLRYAGTKKAVPEIARELKVDGVIEGALVREGQRVRLTAQLVHGPTDRHLWAQVYERDIRDLLLLQSELARAIAREVNVAARPLEPRQRSSVTLVGSVPQELYLRELYLRGRHAETSLSFNGVQAARAYYQRAVDRDSTFALGYAGLATVHWLMADYGFGPIGPALDSARMMARRAVALDSTLPEARTALAATLANSGDFKAADREFQRAIELGPSNAGAHYSYSVLLVALGQGQEALREAQRAAQLDPFGPRGQLAMQRYATWLLTGKRPHLKLPVAQRRPILKVEPGEPWARAREGVEYAERGRCAEARSEIRLAQQLVPITNLEMLKFAALVGWWCGERNRARTLLAEMKRHPDARDKGFHIAWLHAQFGEKDSAFVWLEHQRWTMSPLSALSASRWMDPLRSDPRFSQLLRKLGLRDT